MSTVTIAALEDWLGLRAHWVDADGWTIPRRMAWIANLAMYEGHSFQIEPVFAEELGWVAGYHIAHDADCAACTPEERAAGRVDARPIVATLHRIAFYGPDLDHLVAALEAHDDPDWVRRDHVIAKLRGLRGG